MSSSHIPQAPAAQSMTCWAERLRQTITGRPDRAVVCLDFDGTLAPIVEHPEDARPLPAALDAVDALAGRIRCVAVVTGRPVRTVLDLSGLDHLAHADRVRVFGQYGAERWDGATGEVTVPPVPEAVLAAKQQIPALVDRSAAAGGPVEGVRLEDKGLAIGVHTRSCADPAAALAALEPGLRALAGELGLVVEPGRNVIELRASALTKGDVVRELVAELDPAALAFCGDDRGDIAAFDALRAWRDEEHPGAVVVSGSPEVPDLAERADVLCDGPAGVAVWLGALVDGLCPR
ncbi:trehalose-phosphatase [Propionibacterium australiense]|uniref:Trehalose 6-phosphate phosphatase n=1 Tax=Propionibacterium australiense TaxID=119981 RepID=A0A383S9C3_9ACTN|nr:trehalose-phosphatase [Propionibacterium australiense]RLP08867.1 trehalose-phosphatase [Propionibacterium australiense]SYZ34321.1 HAD-like domain [Propionibacterium australiense]VEH90085.1 Trehalose-phosphate phosphatase [Propionibacterium australiense]